MGVYDIAYTLFGRIHFPGSIPPSQIKKPSFWTVCFWSGRRDLNPRHQPWQGCALPLSYTRILLDEVSYNINFFARQQFFLLYFKILKKNIKSHVDGIIIRIANLVSIFCFY